MLDLKLAHHTSEAMASLLCDAGQDARGRNPNKHSALPIPTSVYSVDAQGVRARTIRPPAAKSRLRSNAGWGPARNAHRPGDRRHSAPVPSLLESVHPGEESCAVRSPRQSKNQSPRLIISALTQLPAQGRGKQRALFGSTQAKAHCPGITYRLSRMTTRMLHSASSLRPPCRQSSTRHSSWPKRSAIFHVTPISSRASSIFLPPDSGPVILSVHGRSRC